jgi:hypothetical protein
VVGFDLFERFVILGDKGLFLEKCRELFSYSYGSNLLIKPYKITEKFREQTRNILITRVLKT